jgi:hypothetical protein
MKSHEGREYSFISLDLGIRWRIVVTLMLRPLYPRSKNPQYPLERSVCGLGSQPILCGV